jgi:hypothetical protein
MFPKKCTLELWIEIFSNKNTTLKKGRKHIIFRFGIHIMCTSQYGIPIVKNPILLQNFTYEKDGLIEHSQESYKV